MSKALRYSEFDNRLFIMMLTPSWLSGIVVLCMTAIVCLGTVMLADYQSSSIRLDYLSYQATKISDAYENISSTLSHNSFISNLPLFAFWSLIGLVVYIFVTNMFAAVNSTAELKTELSYVHVNRKKLIREAFAHLAIRSAVLAVWVVYILFFMHRILPYCLAASLIGTSHEQFLVSTSYVILGFTVLAVALHVHTVLLRLFLLRPRLFSDALYVD